MNINTDKLHWIYKKLFTIRFFEERIKKIAKEKSVPGYLHTCIGSEAICVGVMSALGDDDWVSSTYRNHGHSIAKNCELKEITSEIYGRSSGICKGRGGSMHISDFDKGMLGSFGIVAAGPPVVLGAALQEKINGGTKMSATFFEMVQSIMEHFMKLRVLLNYGMFQCYLFVKTMVMQRLLRLIGI